MRLKELKNTMMNIASSLEMPSLEVRIIIEKVLSLTAIEQIMKADYEVPSEKEQEALALIQKRVQGYPMAYITNEKEFYGNIFYVDENVLIPRPDTEVIVEKTIELSRHFERPRILDLCTGSGAIAASVSKETGLDVAFSDISEKALAIAERNYSKITGKKPISKLGDLLLPWMGHQFDIIASNPPYLTDNWYEEVSEDVKKEPRLALVGFGEDGLDIIRKIVKESKSYLSPGGFLLIEGDYRQMDYCVKLFKSEGFSDAGILKDLAGKERVVYGRRNSEH